MTTIAYRDGILAADSMETRETEAGGSCRGVCQKLFPKRITRGRKSFDVIIATEGESSPGLLFVDWYGTDREPPAVLSAHAAKFTCLILTPHGLFEADQYCRPIEILEPFYAIGTGAQAAMGAMHRGASSLEAVRIAARIDPYTGGRIVSMSLDKPQPRRARKKAK